mmetsp:Transcript_19367/g.73196  ORF Transcript_19367/g.73196 Transcript_19367/m.73196 type:complete len:391 (-) Transcript_19367:7606-8778(-)
MRSPGRARGAFHFRLLHNECLRGLRFIAFFRLHRDGSVLRLDGTTLGVSTALCSGVVHRQLVCLHIFASGGVLLFHLLRLLRLRLLALLLPLLLFLLLLLLLALLLGFRGLLPCRRIWVAHGLELEAPAFVAPSVGVPLGIHATSVQHERGTLDTGKVLRRPTQASSVLLRNGGGARYVREELNVRAPSVGGRLGIELDPNLLGPRDLHFNHEIVALLVWVVGLEVPRELLLAGPRGPFLDRRTGIEFRAPEVPVAVDVNGGEVLPACTGMLGRAETEQRLELPRWRKLLQAKVHDHRKGLAEALLVHRQRASFVFRSRRRIGNLHREGGTRVDADEGGLAPGTAHALFLAAPVFLNTVVADVDPAVLRTAGVHADRLAQLARHPRVVVA